MLFVGMHTDKTETHALGVNSGLSGQLGMITDRQTDRQTLLKSSTRSSGY